jgi:hypothetical protein
MRERSGTFRHGKILVMTWEPPTRDGLRRGRATSGLTWEFEEPATHWAEHDRRLVRYWRSRPPGERLAQAAAYRLRVHGETPDPDPWTWRFVPAGDE